MHQTITAAAAGAGALALVVFGAALPTMADDVAPPTETIEVAPSPDTAASAFTPTEPTAAPPAETPTATSSTSTEAPSATPPTASPAETSQPTVPTAPSETTTTSPVTPPSAPAFIAYTVAQSWTLPSSWPVKTTPSYQPAIFPQTKGATCSSVTTWAQNDVYLIDSPEDVTTLAGLGDTLTMGEDASIYLSHTFTKTAPCAPVVVEVPYPTLVAAIVCGPGNDTVQTDPAWLATWGAFVGGPWIDGKYKTQAGQQVVDGSAQIKAEHRKTHIWADTSSTSASDFRRWMMYPGTAPFVHVDTATECPVVPVDPPVEPEVPVEEPPVEPETPVEEPPVVDVPVEEPVAPVVDPPVAPAAADVATPPAARAALVTETGTLAYTGTDGAVIGLVALFSTLLALTGYGMHKWASRRPAPRYARNLDK